MSLTLNSQITAANNARRLLSSVEGVLPENKLHMVSKAILKIHTSHKEMQPLLKSWILCKLYAMISPQINKEMDYNDVVIGDLLRIANVFRAEWNKCNIEFLSMYTEFLLHCPDRFIIVYFKNDIKDDLLKYCYSVGKYLQKIVAKI